MLLSTFGAYVLPELRLAISVCQGKLDISTGCDIGALSCTYALYDAFAVHIVAPMQNYFQHKVLNFTPLGNVALRCV